VTVEVCPPAADNSGRQLLVFCDGTNNTLNGGQGDTNVLKLAEGLKLGNSNDPQQLIWYDPGVGAAVNLPEATLRNQFKGYLQRLWGLAFGDGVYENIAQAIGFLSRNFQPGDQIYLFGFSRGAFTARAVGGVINQYGLPQPQHLHLLPLLIQRYFSAANSGTERDRKIVAQAQLLTDAIKPFIHFVGVWDTVDEVGFPIPGLTRRIRNSTTLADKCFVHVRHVVALDEHRRLFRPRLYQHINGGKHTARIGCDIRCGTLKQVALPGCHSDIGGGYETSGLSDLSLEWMVREATAPGVGLRVGSYKPRSPEIPTDIRVHSELEPAFGWAVLGQSVRNAAGALTALPLPPALSLGTKPLPTLWRRRSVARLLWWALAALLFGLAAHWISQIGKPFAIPLWQLQAGFGQSLGLPATAEDIARHLWRDTLAFIPSIALLLSLPNSAGFARLAGQRRVGQPAPLWLNALGLALPAYIAADLAGGALTAWLLWLLPCTGGFVSVVAFAMSLAAVAKFTALAGALVLAAVGIWAGVAAWIRRQT
jgi:Uncharacterized alpha/beta hydrolase domain (DUF2235)